MGTCAFQARPCVRARVCVRYVPRLVLEGEIEAVRARACVCVCVCVCVRVCAFV
jgi:hypothetical protein